MKKRYVNMDVSILLLIILLRRSAVSVFQLRSQP